jgi:hypothetical protein
MKKLMLLATAPLLVGCDPSGGMGSINWSTPGTPGVYSCEYAEGIEGGAQAWCDTGEHPNLCDC